MSTGHAITGYTPCHHLVNRHLGRRFIMTDGAASGATRHERMDQR